MISQISNVHQPNFLNKTWRTSVETQETNLKNKKRWCAAKFSAKKNFGEDENGEEKCGWEGEKKMQKNLVSLSPFLETL